MRISTVISVLRQALEVSMPPSGIKGSLDLHGVGAKILKLMEFFCIIGSFSSALIAGMNRSPT